MTQRHVFSWESIRERSMLCKLCHLERREIKVWLRPLAGAAAEPAGTDGSGFPKIPAEVGEAAATVNADVVV